ncbi:MAG: DUF4363 family protein [Peptostreptococcales bacterium]
MKTLIVAILCVIIIICLWAFLVNYMDYSVNLLVSELNRVEDAVLDNNWENVNKNMTDFTELWMDYKEIYGLFVDEDLLFAIDAFQAQVEAFIFFEEQTDVLATIHTLKHELLNIHRRELLTPRNIL